MSSIRLSTVEDFDRVGELQKKERQEKARQEGKVDEGDEVNKRLEDLKKKLKDAGAGQKLNPFFAEPDSEDADDYYDEEYDEEEEEDQNEAAEPTE